MSHAIRVRRRPRLALLAAAAAGQETSLDAGDARALRRESYPAPGASTRARRCPRP
jgi:hypothetical protein